MNLLLLSEGELSGDEAAVEGRRARHLLAVLGKGPGDTVKVGVVGDGVGEAEITRVDRDPPRVVLRLGPRRAQAAPKTSLILALPRPKALSRIVQLAASFGIGRLDLIGAHKVDPSYFSSPRLHPARLAEDGLLGLEQGGHVHLPTFDLRRSFERFVGELAGGSRHPGTRVLFDPVAGRHLADVLWHPQGLAAPPSAQLSAEVTLAFGPDGGFLPDELEQLSAVGFRPASLGTSVLRTEVAVAAGLGQLELCRRLDRNAARLSIARSS